MTITIVTFSKRKGNSKCSTKNQLKLIKIIQIALSLILTINPGVPSQYLCSLLASIFLCAFPSCYSTVIGRLRAPMWEQNERTNIYLRATNIFFYYDLFANDNVR